MTAMPASAEIHVAGLVVRTYPEAVAVVTEFLGSVSGTQVHAGTADGRLVVTIEAAGADEIAERICRIQTTDGVLAAALVYQHSEPAATMDDEVEL
jgi:nitrate reductase NapD